MLKAADRPVADGDYVSIDLRATVDGEEVPGRLDHRPVVRGRQRLADERSGRGADRRGRRRRAAVQHRPGRPATSPAAPPTSSSPSGRSRRRSCRSWTTSSRRRPASSTRSTSCAATCASGCSRVQGAGAGRAGPRQGARARCWTPPRCRCRSRSCAARSEWRQHDIGHQLEGAGLDLDAYLDRRGAHPRGLRRRGAAQLGDRGEEPARAGRDRGRRAARASPTPS